MKIRIRHSMQDYTPDALMRMDTKTLRSLYSDLRGVVNKRLQRMDDTVFTRSQTYREYRNFFKPIKSLSYADLVYKTSEAVRFVIENKGITGMKQKMKKDINALNENGIHGVNAENYFDFLDFMEAYRNSKWDELYDSGDEGVKVFVKSQEQRLDPEVIATNFEDYLNNQSEIEQYLNNHPSRQDNDFNKIRMELQKNGKWRSV